MCHGSVESRRRGHVRELRHPRCSWRLHTKERAIRLRPALRAARFEQPCRRRLDRSSSGRLPAACTRRSTLRRRSCLIPARAIFQAVRRDTRSPKHRDLDLREALVPSESNFLSDHPRARRPKPTRTRPHTLRPIVCIQDQRIRSERSECSSGIAVTAGERPEGGRDSVFQARDTALPDLALAMLHGRFTLRAVLASR
jgi:hypothetical protein